MGKSITRKMRLRPRSAHRNTTTSYRPSLPSNSVRKANAKLRPHDPEFWTVINELSEPIAVSRPELDAIESYFCGVLVSVFGRSRNSWP